MTKRGKIWLMIVAALTVMTACGKKEKMAEPVGVPNNQAGKTNEIGMLNEANNVESDIQNADLSGSISELTANGMMVSKAAIVEGDGEGDVVMHTDEESSHLSIEFTEKTEFKKNIIKNMKEGRLEKGHKSDLVIDDTVYLHGSEAGSKFLATKVIIIKLE